MSFNEKMALSKEYILSAHRELSEALDEFPWKSHRKYSDKTLSKERLAEELMDSIKFVLNIYYIWDITPDEFVEAFFHKSQKVRDRLSDET